MAGPSRNRDRWRPHRSGLINLFKYEDQVFRFENGRLLLRGDNGSGKSRVLALQLPFLLDGELSPFRVEPDRDPAKRMEWHLLMDRHEARTGYTWIEFRRIEKGEPRFLTLGCGMEARVGGGSPGRWFFITPQRIGHDLALVKNRVPLGRRQLAAEFERVGAGTLHDRVGDYRAAVDDALFKLGRRYLPLVDLLIQLRQPQLMRDMKEDVLSAALSEALPPVPDALIHQVAESFQGLDTDRQRSEDHRRMLESVETFREGYVQYLAVAVRRLCEIVRTGHSRFEHAARELRAIDGNLAALAERIAALRAEAATARDRLAALETAAATLRDSPEMRGARELERVRRRATECEADAAEAEAAWERARGHRDRAVEESARRARRLEELGETVARGHAALAGAFETIAPPGFPPVFDWRTTGIADARSQIQSLVEARRRNVAHLRERNDAIERLRRIRERARDRMTDAREALAEAAAHAQDAEDALEAALDRFAADVTTWEESLTVLHVAVFPRDRNWSASVGEWLADRAGEPPLTGDLRRAADRVRNELAATRAAVVNERRAAESEREMLTAERAELAEGRPPVPAPRPTRGPRREDRPGAPFWRRFEFRDEVPASDHAGWEAALEASGLLDAWTTPDGLLDPETAAAEEDDFAVVVARDPELAEGDSLAAILRPATPGDGAALGSLLRRIGNHEGSARCWIARNGRWANGPHVGRWRKAAAEFLGSDAREGARLRRLAELERELETVAGRLDALDARVAEYDRLAKRLDAEVAAAPAVGPLVEAAVGAERDRAFHESAKARLLEAEQSAAEATAGVADAVARRDAEAADLGLADAADPDRLAAFDEGLTRFASDAAAFWPVREIHLAAEDEHRRAAERASEAAEDERRLDEVRAARRERAARARSEADTLDATIGESAHDVMRRLDDTEAAAAAALAGSARLDDALRSAEIEEARLAEQRLAAGEKRESAEATRNHAVTRIAAFVNARLVDEVDPEHPPDRADLSATAAVDLARRLEKHLEHHPHDDERWHRLQSEIVARFNELGDQLGRHGLVPHLRTIDESSVSVITCEYQGRERTAGELADLLRDELASRERIFEEREREVIENHLIGEAAAELQRLIRDGEESREKTNAEMTQVATSSGIRIRFTWGPADPDDERLLAVRRIFLRTSATWSLAERETVGAFLQERIRSSREADDTLTWREHLRRALDYRAWHRFGIQLRRDGDTSWRHLTKRTFGTGSGGEKALTLTVPQFAAVAAHYRSAHPHAPRLILLDEAFVAIDAPTRARLMGLLETFDLDYVMTSEREWGIYPTVSDLAIYQLATRPGYDAVAVTRWVWNGSALRRDDTHPEESSTTPDDPAPP